MVHAVAVLVAACAALFCDRSEATDSRLDNGYFTFRSIDHARVEERRKREEQVSKMWRLRREAEERRLWCLRVYLVRMSRAARNMFPCGAIHIFASTAIVIVLAFRPEMRC